MTWEKKLREYPRLRERAVPDEEKLLSTIQRAKKAFAEGEMEQPVSWAVFLFQQAAYIQKRWWMAQGIVLAALWRLLCITESSSYLKRSMGILAPLFAILLLPELWKNKRSASMEIEGTVYFPLQKIYAARLLLFAMVDILLLSSFFAAAALTVQLSIGEMVVHFFLPFNVTCCICFRCLCSRRFGTGYHAAVLCILWTAVWLLIILQDAVYQKISGPVWAAAVLGSAAYLACSIYRVWKSCGSIGR